MYSGQRQLVAHVAALQDRVVKEVQRARLNGDRLQRDLAFDPQLVLGDVVQAEQFGRTAEVL